MIVGVNEQDNKQDMDKFLSESHALANNKDNVLFESRYEKNDRIRMGDMLEGLDGYSDRVIRNTAVMLENQRKYFSSLSETTKLVNVGDFEKYAFPMVRTIFPNLAAHNLASVQPMLGPSSTVFYMKFTYGNSKGSATAGQDIVEFPNEHFSSDYIDVEKLDDGDGATTTLGTGTLTYVPVQAGTFKLTTVSGAVALEITDDGNGALIGNTGGGTNTVDYATGAVAVDWVSAPDAGVPINAAYHYDLEANNNVPSVDLHLANAPIQAITRKLRTRWSVESAMDLRNLFGLEAEVEQVAAISNELKFEIDRDIISGMRNITTATVPTFSKTPGTGISFTEHKLNFIDTLIEASNTIFSNTQRATGTWLLCGLNVSSLIESLPGFVPSPRPKGTRAVYKAGVLNGTWEIWKDPNYSADQFLMGYQGDSMWEVGYIFAPYILAYTTGTIALDDFINRKGIASRYGKYAVDSRFFVSGAISA